MRPPATAIPPSSMTRRLPSIVTIVPPRTRRSTCRLLCAATFDGELASMVIRTKQISSRILFLLQEPRIKSARQQVGDVKLFSLPVEVREHDPRASRKLPDYLPASTARRRQRLGVSNYGQRRELSL